MESVLGVPTYGAETAMDREIYERLRSEGQILEKEITLRQRIFSNPSLKHPASMAKRIIPSI